MCDTSPYTPLQTPPPRSAATPFSLTPPPVPSFTPSSRCGHGCCCFYFCHVPLLRAATAGTSIPNERDSEGRAFHEGHGQTVSAADGWKSMGAGGREKPGRSKRSTGPFAAMACHLIKHEGKNKPLLSFPIGTSGSELEVRYSSARFVLLVSRCLLVHAGNRVCMWYV